MKGTIRNRKKSHKRGGGNTSIMNCNPRNITHRISRGTCLTSDAVFALKGAINKKQTKSIVKKVVKGTDPVDILAQVKEGMSTICEGKRDDCLINQLPEISRKQFQESLFAPYKPIEWKKDPNEWLSNFDILAVLNQFKYVKNDFRVYDPTSIDFDTRLDKGCVSDELCNFSLKDELSEGIHKFGMIFNLSRHDEMGTHWVSLFVDTHDKFIFYFDSGKSRPPQEVTQLVNRIKNQGTKLGIDFTYHETAIQHQSGSTECGMYALYFMVTMITSKTITGTKMSKCSKLNHFKYKRIADDFVFKLRDKYFNNV